MFQQKPISPLTLQFPPLQQLPLAPPQAPRQLHRKIQVDPIRQQVLALLHKLATLNLNLRVHYSLKMVLFQLITPVMASALAQH